jgi:transmembrane sensor
MDYRTFDVEDFLADENFTRWVTHPTTSSDTFWKNWLALNPERREILNTARQLQKDINFTETWKVGERLGMWEQIREGMHDKLPVAPLFGSRAAWFRLSCAAAIAGILFTTAWLFVRWRNIDIATQYGKQQDITLADGSRVTLNGNSRLTFTRNFAKAEIREVWIEGEAFFDVARMVRNGRKVPFTVHTKQLDIEVLGTAFNVNSRRSRVDVALEHGSVKLTDPDNAANTLLLKPGEKATQVAKTAPLQKEAVNVNEYSSWKQHVVQYRGKTLDELAQMLNDSYGIDITIENEALRRETFTGSFPTDSVSVFFEKLVKLYPLDMSRNGEKYYLR